MTVHGQFAALEDSLLSRGFSRSDADRVLGENAVELIAAVCG